MQIELQIPEWAINLAQQAGGIDPWYYAIGAYCVACWGYCVREMRREFHRRTITTEEKADMAVGGVFSPVLIPFILAYWVVQPVLSRVSGFVQRGARRAKNTAQKSKTEWADLGTLMDKLNQQVDEREVRENLGLPKASPPSTDGLDYDKITAEVMSRLKASGQLVSSCSVDAIGVSGNTNYTTCVISSPVYADDDASKAWPKDGWSKKVEEPKPRTPAAGEPIYIDADGQYVDGDGKLVAINSPLLKKDEPKPEPESASGTVIPTDGKALSALLNLVGIPTGIGRKYDQKLSYYVDDPDVIYLQSTSARRVAEGLLKLIAKCQPRRERIVVPTEGKALAAFLGTLPVPNDSGYSAGSNGHLPSYSKWVADILQAVIDKAQNA